MQFRFRKHQSGFTLIELLVVVAIIALLISILLPSLRAAREQGKQVVCLTHLRNQGTASNFYGEDNQDFLLAGILSNQPIEDLTNPPLCVNPYTEYGLAHQYWLPYLDYQPAGDGKQAEKRRWERLWTRGYRNDSRAQERMDEAFRGIESYQCPSFPLVTSEDASITTLSDMDFVANAMPIPFTKTNAKASDLNQGNDSEGVPVCSVHYWGQRRRANIRRPGDFIYIAEADESLVRRDLQRDGDDFQSFIFSAFFTGSHLPKAAEPRVTKDRYHTGGVNAIFFDNHAETMSEKSIDPGWPKSMGIRLRWFTDTSSLRKGRW